jgi:hypothetical protein
VSRNRKNQSAAARFVPALKALSFCLFLGSAGVGYVWQKQQINALQTRLTQDEGYYDRLRKDNAHYSRTLESLQTLPELELRIKQMKLGLGAPQPDQIVRIQEGPVLPEATTNLEPPLYAAQRAATR